MESIDACAAYRTIINRSGLSKAEVSRRIGKSDNYIAASLSQGGTPSLDLFARVAEACGFTLTVERDGEVFNIVPESPTEPRR